MAGRGSTGALLAAAVACVALVQTALAGTMRGEPFQLDDILSERFYQRKIQLTWISGSEIVYEKNNEILVLNVKTNEPRVVVPRQVYDKFNPSVYLLSADKRYVLLGYDVEKVFRHAAVARYVAYNIKENTTADIGNGERLQLVKWSPAGNALAYVWRNDVYYLPQVDGRPVWVTDDGVPDHIYNGVACEWTDYSLSADESLNKDGDVYWSPGGRRLMFGRCDVSSVQTTSFLRYGRPGTLDDQYPTVVSFRYAKPGTAVPKVKAMLASLPDDAESSVTVQELMAPTDVLGEDCQPEDSIWTDDRTVVLSWRNRVSNAKQFMFYNADTDAKRIQGRKGLKVEQKAGWLGHQVSHLRKGISGDLLTIDWEPQGGAVSFPHVIAFTERSRRALTSGALAVTDIYGGAAEGTVYYQATEEGQPSRRQVYAVRERGKPRCLSCDVTSPEGNPCLRASASFSRDFSWYALTCLGPDPPFTMLRSTAATDDSWVEWMERGRRRNIRTQLQHMQQPRQLDAWVDVGEGLRAQVRLWLPPGLDPKGSEKRPAIVFVNAGPGEQLVDDSFEVGLQHYFTTSRRYVYIVIDGRGAGGRDSRTLFSVYRRLGSVEVDDQISVTKWLTEKYRFIDATSVGIWGMSYGGYAAAMALARDEDVFKCAASVMPVTSWIYTDALTTEMHMGLPTPEDNEVGYNKSDVTRLANRFRSNTFFLAHGTADDIVHYQHSMMMARALEDANLLFRQQSYPDQDHTMSQMRSHLYRCVDDFFVHCFNGGLACKAQRAEAAAEFPAWRTD